ncbi:MAG: D-ribitol-5-phosphate phosphatase [Anaerolineae bacterium]|nr:D-ribitol-5-phosphate phosphatase [Anaerolineae bacterium]
MSFRAIFFDLGMVLVTFDWSVAIARFGKLGIPAARVQTFLDDPLHEAFERSALSEQEFLARGLAMTGFDGAPAEFKKYWNEIFTPLAANIELARQLAARFPLYVISNTNPWHMEYLEAEYAWLQIFRERFYSPALGLRKPDARIFEIALARAQVAPQDALFLDDRLENIHGAQAVGMQTLHVPTPQRVTIELEKLVERTREAP